MSYSNSILSFWTEAKSYLELQKEYLKLDAAEKLTVLLSVVATAVLCLVLGAMALLFLLLALGFWLGHVAGNSFIGFLIIGGSLLLAIVIVLLRRKKWIVQPLARFMAGLFIEDSEVEDAV